MYVLTLEINNQCNLNCTYCYKGIKTNKFMSLETAQKAVMYAIDIVLRNHKDRKLKINFLGGEPLISFELITKTINFCENCGIQIIFIYTITSNGLLLDENIVNYLIDKRIRLKISMDGEKQVHDINRINYNGTGSYDQLSAKFSLLSKYENLSQTYIQISNVITKNNYRYLCSSIRHNIFRGFRYLDSGMDSTDSWEDEFDSVEKEILAAVEYYINYNVTHEPVVWTFFNKIRNADKPQERLYSCGAGVISLYILPDGSAYPCPDAIGTEIKLGNINDQITLSAVNSFINARKMKSSVCSECEYDNNCRGRGCLVQNIKINGDMYKVTKFNCWFTKLSGRISSQYADILKSHPAFLRIQ